MPKARAISRLPALEEVPAKNSMTSFLEGREVFADGLVFGALVLEAAFDFAGFLEGAFLAEAVFLREAVFLGGATFAA